MNIKELTSFIHVAQKLRERNLEKHADQPSSELSFPFPVLETTTNLVLALAFAPRAGDSSTLKNLPYSKFSSTSNDSFTIEICDYPDDKHSKFTLEIANNKKGHLGMTISPSPDAPIKIKTGIFALEHIPILTKLKTKLHILESGITISEITTTSSKDILPKSNFMTYQNISVEVDSIVKEIAETRTGLGFDLIKPSEHNDKLIFLLNTKGIFETIRFDISNDVDTKSGLSVRTLGIVDENRKFAKSPHRGEVVARFETAINQLIPIFIGSLLKTKEKFFLGKDAVEIKQLDERRHPPS